MEIYLYLPDEDINGIPNIEQFNLSMLMKVEKINVDI
jgi:hypothetical protein